MSLLIALILMGAANLAICSPSDPYTKDCAPPPGFNITSGLVYKFPIRPIEKCCPACEGCDNIGGRCKIKWLPEMYPQWCDFTSINECRDYSCTCCVKCGDDKCSPCVETGGECRKTCRSGELEDTDNVCSYYNNGTEASCKCCKKCEPTRECTDSQGCCTTDPANCEHGTFASTGCCGGCYCCKPVLEIVYGGVCETTGGCYCSETDECANGYYACLGECSKTLSNNGHKTSVLGYACIPKNAVACDTSECRYEPPDQPLIISGNCLLGNNHEGRTHVGKQNCRGACKCWIGINSNGKHLDDLTPRELRRHSLLQFDRPFEDRFTYRGDNNTVYVLDNEKYSSTGDSYPIIIPAMEDFTTNRYHFKKLLNYPQGKCVVPSRFDQDVKEAYNELYDVYCKYPGDKGILMVAVNAKAYVNEYIHIQTLKHTIAYDSDYGNDSPPQYEVFPELYSDDCTTTGPCKKTKIDEYPQDLTENEWKVSYYREDTEFNNFHGNWHNLNPGSSAKTISHGELFYYFHNQLIARYNMERLSNGLDPVKPLDNWSSAYQIPENYIPPILKQYKSRCPTAANPASYMSSEPLEQHLAINRDQLENDISLGILRDPSNVAYTIVNEEGIGNVGCALEAARCGSHSTSLYGSIHNIGHSIFSQMGCPVGNNRSGVVGNPWTAVRDPIFFRWHKFVDGVLQSQKKLLPEYNLTKLLMNEVSILNISVVSKGNEGELHTFNSKVETKCLSQPSTNHYPFTYHITIDNQKGELDVNVRIYLAPEKYFSNYTEQREHWTLMDRFKSTLKNGNNVIIRESCDSSITIPPKNSLQELLNNLGEVGESSTCQCGLPEHLLIPRGHPNGTHFNLFVYITPYDITQEQPSDCNNNLECSDLCATDYNKCLRSDSEAMGFPFDRPLTSLNGTPINTIFDLEGMLSNAKLYHIIIFYNKTQSINGRQCSN